MTQKHRYIFSISLVFILLTPVTIKLFDSTFHHHDHFICTAKNAKHFHEYHKTCPIPGFVLSLYSINKLIHINHRVSYYEDVTNNIITRYYKKPRYSFSLRAPPLNITC